MQLPPAIQKSLQEGKLSMGHARALLGTPDRAFQEQLAKRIVDEDLSVRAVEDAVREHQGEHEARPRPTTPATASNGSPARRQLRPPGLVELEELLGDHLETRVKISMGSVAGQGRGRVLDPRGPRADLPADDRRRGGPDHGREHRRRPELISLRAQVI